MTHAPLDALHTPTGRLVQVCTTCETDDGDWVLWPCAVVRESRDCVSAGQTGCGGVTEREVRETMKAHKTTPGLTQRANADAEGLTDWKGVGYA